MIQLPDSRLKSTIGEVMAEMKDDFGVTHRVRMRPVYCFNCGCDQGYVTEFVTNVAMACWPCAEKFGTTWAEHCVSDADFWSKVLDEMYNRFGRALTQDELFELGEKGKLGHKLELLARESPYRVK